MSSARYTAKKRVIAQSQDKKVQIDTRLALSNSLVSAVGCSLDYQQINWTPVCSDCYVPSGPIPPPCPPLNLLDYGTLDTNTNTFTLTQPLTILPCQRLTVPYIFYNDSIFFENNGTVIFNNLLFTNGNFFNYRNMTFNGDVTVRNVRAPLVLAAPFSNRGGTIINNATLSSQIVPPSFFFFNTAGAIFNNTNGTINNIIPAGGLSGFGNSPLSTVCGGIVNGPIPAGYTLSC